MFNITKEMFIMIIIILGSYTKRFITPLRAGSKRSVFFLQGMWRYVLKYKTYSY